MTSALWRGRATQQVGFRAWPASEGAGLTRESPGRRQKLPSTLRGQCLERKQVLAMGLGRGLLSCKVWEARIQKLGLGG